MHILILDDNGKYHIVKKSSIRRVTSTFSTERTTVQFFNPRENPAIYVSESVQEFFSKYLSKK